MRSAPRSAAESQVLLNSLVALLDESYSRQAWHGATLKGALRGMSAQQAAWRPAPSRHSVAEIVVHAAYWKYAVRRRLSGGERGGFPIKGSNWFAIDADVSEADWRGHIRLLDQQHAQLRIAVETMNPAHVISTAEGRKVSNLRLIRGIAMHDVYHAGQVQTLKALYKSAGS